MDLNSNDIIKFYELLKHYDKISTNIGLIGNKEQFNRIMNTLKTTIPHDIIIMDSNKQKYRFILEDHETTFIWIKTTDDLEGLYFRKYQIL